MLDVGKEIGNVALAEMIKTIGAGIAQSQFEIQRMNAELAQWMAGGNPETGEPGFLLNLGGKPYSLMEMGFIPTCYSIADTVIDVKVSISMASQKSQPNLPIKVSVGGSGYGYRTPFAAGVSARLSFVAASYASKYSYKSDASSSIHTRLVAVPAPAVFQERMQRLKDKS